MAGPHRDAKRRASLPDTVGSNDKSAESAFPPLNLSITIGSADKKAFLTPQTVELLVLVGQHGSISAAARRLGRTYKWAWNAIDALARLFGQDLVAARRGGVVGGGSDLTPVAASLISGYRAVEDAANRARRSPCLGPLDHPAPDQTTKPPRLVIQPGVKFNAG